MSSTQMIIQDFRRNIRALEKRDRDELKGLLKLKLNQKAIATINDDGHEIHYFVYIKRKYPKSRTVQVELVNKEKRVVDYADLEIKEWII